MNEVKPEIIKQEKKDSYTYLKVGTILFLVIAWIILIGLKMSKVIGSSKVSWTIMGGITILGLIVVFGKNVFNLFNREEKESELKPMSKEEIEEILNLTVESLSDHIRLPKDILVNTRTGKAKNDIVYVYEVDLVYSGKKFIIINGTDKRIMPSIVSGETKQPTLEKLINAKFLNPIESEIETIEEGVDNFGKPIRKTQKITPKEEQKKEELI